jgi:hypothetical protein
MRSQQQEESDMPDTWTLRKEGERTPLTTIRGTQREAMGWAQTLANDYRWPIEVCHESDPANADVVIDPEKEEER